MSHTKPYFLLDIDGVVADFYMAVCRVVAEVSDEPVECIDWDFTQNLYFQRPDDYSHYRQRSSEPEFCYDIPVVDGAVDFVSRLRRNFRVVAVTSPLSHCPTWESERRRWLRDYLQFDKRDVVFCTDKSHVAGDFLLDDKPENVEEWAAEWGNCELTYRGIIWDQPYNHMITGPRLRGFDAVVHHVESAISHSSFRSNRRGRQ